ncbi:MAG: acetate/propionate family kinase [Caulobacteraceae bacterium]|nr:acetate/propionate family kinase [Caulobacteraceae bacterium]
MSSPETVTQAVAPAKVSPDGCVAVVNAGSSSVKFAIYEPDARQDVRYHGKIEGIGTAPRLKVERPDGETVSERSWRAEALDVQAATLEVLRTAADLIRGSPIAGIGHRVVHGGTDFAAPIRVDDAVVAALKRLIPLAPLHQPFNLAAIEAIAQAAPHIPQVACFDTAFHRSQPALAQLFGLPRKFAEEGVRRYGFHGLSYEYIAGRLAETAPELARGRVIAAHLGNGASLCAMKGGRCVATTMGFTAVDGLLMGTRCGTLDPGVVLYLMDEKGLSVRDVEDLVYRRSGLLGVSGVSSDMRGLRASPEPAAAEAIALFVYRVVREAGSLAAALGGLDGLVFTAGIGENDPQTRAEIAAGCAWLGLELDETRNARGSGRVSRDGSPVEVWVIPTNEEAMIARHAAAVLATI